MRHLSIVMAAAVFAAGLFLVVVRARRRAYGRRARTAGAPCSTTGRTDVSIRPILGLATSRPSTGCRRISARTRPRTTTSRGRCSHGGPAVPARNESRDRASRSGRARRERGRLRSCVDRRRVVTSGLRRAGRRLARARPRHARVAPRRPRSDGRRRGALHRSLVRHRRDAPAVRGRPPRPGIRLARAGRASSRACVATGSSLSSRSTARRAGRTAAVAPNWAPKSALPFGSFARAAASRYPWIRYWTIWNEPNRPEWLRPTTPATYVRTILNPAYAAIRATIRDARSAAA